MCIRDKSLAGILITGAITILLSIGGSFLTSVIKLSSVDTKTQMQQQTIDKVSNKMDRLNDNQAFLSSQMATVIEELKYKQDK